MKSAIDSAIEARRDVVAEHYESLCKIILIPINKLKDDTQAGLNALKSLTTRIGAAAPNNPGNVDNVNTASIVAILDWFTNMEKDFSNAVLQKLIPNFQKITNNLFKAPPMPGP